MSCMQARVGADVELIDRSTLQPQTQARAVFTESAHVKKTGWLTLARVWMCLCVRKGFPTAPRAFSPLPMP